MSQNYNYSNGKVGNWRGLPVEVMKEDEFRNQRFTPNATTIYAVSVGDDDDLVLVLKDTMIGTMSPDGHVSEYDSAVPFERIPKKKKSQNKFKDKHEAHECPVRTSAEYNVEELTAEDLYALSAPIDAYLAEALAKDWLAVG